MINKDAALKWGGIFFVCGMKQKKGSLFEDFLSSERGDSNARPLRPERSALPTALLSDCFRKWCHQESNRGHKDFQSFALPTELWHLACLRVQM